MSDTKHPAEVLDESFHISSRMGWRTQARAQLRRIPALEAERDQLRVSLAASEASDAESIRMYRAARDERDQLRAEVEALRADAERYRFMRRPFMSHRQYKEIMYAVDELSEELMDSAIDAARKQQ